MFNNNVYLCVHFRTRVPPPTHQNQYIWGQCKICIFDLHSKCYLYNTVALYVVHKTFWFTKDSRSIDHFCYIVFCLIWYIVTTISFSNTLEDLGELARVSFDVVHRAIYSIIYRKSCQNLKAIRRETFNESEVGKCNCVASSIGYFPRRVYYSYWKLAILKNKYQLIWHPIKTHELFLTSPQL